MSGPISGPHFHQPNPFEQDTGLRVRNSKHALSTLREGLKDMQEGVNNENPNLIISGIRKLDHSTSVIKQNIEQLNFDTLDTWDQVEPELNQFKNLCNNGSMTEVAELIQKIHPHLEAFSEALNSN